MQNRQIPVITADYLMSLLTMLEQLTAKVDRIATMLENIAVPAAAQTPPAPARLEVSLSFLAAATGTSKSTLERRIAADKLPKPRTNPDNGYRFWFRSDLPKGLHPQIDAHYDAIRASR
ncbi:hypothetical protein KL86DPRO_20502 [uncultured delta proteobacterium]|uniref:Uncharacterized protein n=1 Tax=uncultured delta proteobacterium TaxID=34034 RepID=A0A212K1K7_9DELT|nr:hypothetical protein KL86DPRO_20502 [uncultured delta proteobacterium]